MTTAEITQYYDLEMPHHVFIASAQLDSGNTHEFAFNSLLSREEFVQEFVHPRQFTDVTWGFFTVDQSAVHITEQRVCVTAI